MRSSLVPMSSNAFSFYGLNGKTDRIVYLNADVATKLLTILLAYAPHFDNVMTTVAFKC